MLITTNPTLGKKAKKEMLSVCEEADGHSTRKVIRINYSSLELLQTCKRKAFYALKENLSSSEEGSATLFGSAIHKALEVWYSAPKKDRRLKASECDPNGSGIPTHVDCVHCASIAAFERTASTLFSLDIGDKRHPYNGYRILNAYFEKFFNDPFEVYIDASGPVVERRFEFTLIDEPKLKVIYFGTIDVILRNTETNTILVCDHKTTSSLGVDFYNRIKPNHQYTGYVAGARLALGIDTDLFLVNGIQVAKTKCDFARQITQRTEEDFRELYRAVVWAVDDWCLAEEQSNWPQNAPNPCTMYGGCQFRNVCEAPPSLRPQIMKSMFQIGGH